MVKRHPLAPTAHSTEDAIDRKAPLFMRKIVVISAVDCERARLALALRGQSDLGPVLGL